MPWLFLGALVLTETVPTVETSMLYPALPALIETYGDAVLAFWVLTMFYVVAGASVALCARLGDMFGRRRLLLCVLAISLCGSLISAISTSIGGLLLGRALYAVASAAGPLCFGIIRGHFPANHIPFAVAMVSTGVIVSGGIGMLFGGILLDHFPWHAIFVVSSSLALLSFAAVWRLVPADEENTHKVSVDWLGGLLMVPAIAGLLSTIFLGKTWGWTSPPVFIVLAASLCLLGWWVAHELNQREPLIDVRLLGRRQIGLGNLAIAVFALGMLQQGTVMVVLLQQPAATLAGFGISASLTGMLFAPIALTGLVGGPWSGRIAAKYGARRATLIGALISGLPWLPLALDHSSFWVLLILFYAGNVGVTMVFCAIPNLIIEAAPPDRTSETTGVSVVVRQIATGTGTQLVAFVLAWPALERIVLGDHDFTSGSTFTLLFCFFAACAFLAAFLIWRIPPSPHRFARASAVVDPNAPGAGCRSCRDR